ncbi:peptidoglycan editing factor PgeF [Bowmanella sp. JS7-9]|uniref:Purine nucleoside phosphorylase n=1 Tax=Pseudobowmanella zhangzhouensis TaxID=1537679 RepID=A0ABW1XGQ2_9ALTE|nr:peptidoglycan editing factor PgeF [Bowmanella sp. JS7-9]TBX21017.1 hypothetical protein TK45_13180 [Bowmanella sp. JS7-9]
MVIVPEWNLPVPFRAFYTTRSGGVSSGTYASLNLGAHVGDAPHAVIANRALLPHASRIQWLNQTHSTDVVSLTGYAAKPADADASFTATEGLVCAVMTADCLPVLIADPETMQVAAIHAGWRGLANGIIENTLQQMGCSDAALAWIGPAISQPYFEVGAEVREAFLLSEHDYFVAREDKHLCDLAGIAGQRLRSCGLTAITQSQECTFSQPEKYFSYRRDGQTGRLVSGIYLDPNQ